MRWIVLCIVGIAYLWLPVAYSQPVEGQMLSYDAFMQRVVAHHPVVQQGQLLVAQGEANILKARGGFDPKLAGDLSQKQFNDSRYYNIAEGALKVPTWFGIEGKVAYQQADGTYLNPERTVPDAGLWLAGVSVPLGEGLFMDQRRAALRQAQTMLKANKAERQSMVNDLLLEAAKAYWEWQAAYRQMRILDNAVQLALNRYNFTIVSFQQGDKPAIDTTEAYLQVQQLQLMYNEAAVAFRNAGLQLSTFLWLERGIPLEVTEAAIPDTAPTVATPLPVADSLQQWVAQLANQHPDLLQYRFKLEALDIQRQLRLEQLKPDLFVTYNFLTSTVGGDEIIAGTLENYKFGITFQMPLFMRKERGNLRAAQLKWQSAALALEQKTLEQTNKVEAYINTLSNLNNQLTLVSEMVTNYERMVTAERQLFRQGESSLFLVNSREQKYINAALKQVELQVKYQKARAGLSWASGRLYREWRLP